MHLAVDDYSRYASVSIMADETAESVAKYLIEYAARGKVIQRVLTDNGSGKRSKKIKEAWETHNVKQGFT